MVFVEEEAPSDITSSVGSAPRKDLKAFSHLDSEDSQPNPLTSSMNQNREFTQRFSDLENVHEPETDRQKTENLMSQPSMGQPNPHGSMESIFSSDESVMNYLKNINPESLIGRSIISLLYV